MTKESKNKKDKLSVSLDKEIVSRLEIESEKEGLTLSTTLNRILRKFFSKKKSE